MVPTLSPGQIVWCHQVRQFTPGQVVVAFVKGREVVKRIKSIENGRVFLIGDNEKQSTDSRYYGNILDSSIEGTVFWPRNL